MSLAAPPREAARRVTVITPDGARLAAWVAEPATARPAATVVLAHGWALTHDAWSRVVPLVQAVTGARVITYDQRGHGASDAHPGTSRRAGHASVHGLGDDLAAVLAALAPDGPLVLGGHSMGGMTVMAYCGSHRSEVEARVRGVLLVSTSAGDLHGLGVLGETTLMRCLAHVPLLRPGRTVTAKGQRRLLFGERAAAADIADVRAMVAATTCSTIGRYYAALGRHDESEALRGLARLTGVHTRVLVGDRDRLTPVEHARRIAELVPHARLDVLPGCGHMLGFEAPQRVAAELIDLLSDLGPA